VRKTINNFLNKKRGETKMIKIIKKWTTEDTENPCLCVIINEDARKKAEKLLNFQVEDVYGEGIDGADFAIQYPETPDSKMWLLGVHEDDLDSATYNFALKIRDAII
jgi:hypothetical protein